MADESLTLRQRLARVPQIGRVVWIGTRPARREPLEAHEQTRALAGRGLEGDRSAKRSGGKRQVTLIQAEHLPVIAAMVGRSEVDPAILRRNLVVEGINLRSLQRLRFRIGEAAEFEGTGPCDPCSRMDEALGEGGFHAMLGHGGITARILIDGPVRLGDAVRALELIPA